MPSNPALPPPDENILQQAALTYLARYATTEAGLRLFLIRRVDRWARAQTDPDAASPVIARAREAIEGIIGRLTQTGVVSDTAFAESRTRVLVRGGQSNRQVQARLIAKGVAPEMARAASDSDPDTELAAALVLARKRRIGPFRTLEADAASRVKELGLLARAGFSRDISTKALETSREEAESRIFDLRR
jgi:regulatory protein